MSDFSNTSNRSGFEPELGGIFRESETRTGFEPELGGALRQKGAYVDENRCIGCKHCAHTAPNTFYIESEHGRARVFNQDGDSLEIIEEAIDTCPVNCIHWVDWIELKQLEADRKYQIIEHLALPPAMRKSSMNKKSRMPGKIK
ncbi:ferredoxin [Myxosarcina sp. GI1]|uniref:ferredoxin n=1 Tax=Myxosarcina sp. GI1 TaxID=1541065 RepID=UPI0005622341|nr:ferredoxin [Myxosarcina sp. GI1]